MRQRWAVLLPVLVLLSACATMPAGPHVMVLLGAGKPFDQFQVDDAICRQFAQQQIGGVPASQVSARDTLSGAAIGTAVGASLGAVIGAAAGRPDVGAAVGAGTGLLTGATASMGTQQYRYDVAYVQCMYAKGNQVPGAVSARQPGFGPPPPPSAPPPPPAQMPPPR